MQQPEIPEGAITAKQYKEMVGCSLAHANNTLRKWCENGTWARATEGVRHWYWPVSMPGVNS